LLRLLEVLAVSSYRITYRLSDLVDRGILKRNWGGQKRYKICDAKMKQK